MKRNREDKEWQDHLDPALVETEALLHQMFKNQEVSLPSVVDDVMLQIVQEEKVRLSWRARLSTILGTISVAIGTIGGIAVLAYVILHVGHQSKVSIFGATFATGKDLLVFILGCSSGLLGLTFIGYSLIRGNKTRLMRLEGTVGILIVGTAAALIGAIVEISQGWILATVTPGTLIAIGVTFGGLVAIGSGSFTSFIRHLSSIALALTGVVLVAIGVVSLGLLNSPQAQAVQHIFTP